MRKGGEEGRRGREKRKGGKRGREEEERDSGEGWREGESGIERRDRDRGIRKTRRKPSFQPASPSSMPLVPPSTFLPLLSFYLVPISSFSS